MSIFLLLRQYTAAFFRKFSWAGLGLLVLAHLLISYSGILLAGEKHLIDPVTFFYFYMTTTLTVGYGDLSPQSPAGRVFVAVWIMLGGIALLTTLIGKTTNTVIELWRLKMKGKGNFADRAGHTVLIGWSGRFSERVIDLLHQDEVSNDEMIVICADNIEENPMPDKALFVRGDQLTSLALLQRAGIAGAERVLIYAANDDQTLAVVLAVNSLNPSGHVVAHFSDSEKANLARIYAPSLECTSSMAIEMLVRSSQDPGSSSLTNELLCSGQGATQYRMALPENTNTKYGSLFLQLKSESNATLLAYQPLGTEALMVNPPIETPIAGGFIYYLAAERLKGLPA